MKTCKGCGLDLPLDAFSPLKKAADGLRYKCKPCMRIDKRIYYEARKEVISRQGRESRLRRSEKIKAYKRSVLERSRVAAKARRALEPEKWAEYGKRYRKKHPEKYQRDTKTYGAKRRGALMTSYVVERLSRGSSLTDWPQELIEAKRLHLQIKRLLQEKP